MSMNPPIHIINQLNSVLKDHLSDIEKQKLNLGDFAREGLEVRIKERKRNLKQLSNDKNPFVSSVAAKLLYLIEDFEKNNDPTLINKYKDDFSLEKIDKEVQVPAGYQVTTELPALNENQIVATQGTVVTKPPLSKPTLQALSSQRQDKSKENKENNVVEKMKKFKDMIQSGKEKKIFEKSLMELVKQRVLGKNLQDQDYSARDIFDELARRIKVVDQKDLTKKAEDILESMIKNASARGQIIAPAIAQLSIAMGNSQDIYLMIDILKARTLFDQVKKRYGQNPDELLSLLKLMKEKYFNPANPAIKNSGPLIEVAREICETDKDTLSKLLGDKMPLFAEILGDVPETLSVGKENPNSIFKRLDTNVLQPIREKEIHQLQVIFKGKSDDRAILSSALKIKSKDDELKQDQKSNHKQLNNLFRLLRSYQSRPDSQTLEKILAEVVNIEKNNDLMRNLNEDVDTANHIKLQFSKSSFSVSDQELIAAHLSKTYPKKDADVTLFDRIFQARIKDYEKQVVSKIVGENPKGKNDETAVRKYFFNIIKDIDKKEFEGLAWSKKDAKEKSPNVYKISNEIVRLTDLVKQEILLAKDNNERQNIFRNYCHILAAAIENHDTAIIYAISSAFVGPEIAHLKIYDTMPDKKDIIPILNLAEKITVPFSSFKYQRAFEKEAPPERPIVRGIVTLLNDLTFAHEGNLDHQGELTEDGKSIMDRIMTDYLDKDKISAYLQQEKYDPSSAHENPLIKRMQETALIFDSKTAVARMEEIRQNKPHVKLELHLINWIDRVNATAESNLKELSDSLNAKEALIGIVNHKIEAKEFDAQEIATLRKDFIKGETILAVLESARLSQHLYETANRFLTTISTDNPEYQQIKDKSETAKVAAQKAWALVDKAREVQKNLNETKAKLPAPVASIGSKSAGMATSSSPAGKLPVSHEPTPAELAQALIDAQKAPVVRKRSAKPDKAAAQAASESVIRTSDEAFKTNKLKFFMGGFANSYRGLQDQISSDPKDQKSKEALVKMEATLRGAAIHADKEVREKAIKIMNEFEIFGKPENSYVKQLLSGFKDPTIFDPKSPPSPGEIYTEEDLNKRASGLIEHVKPEQFMKEFFEFYDAQKKPENREAILKNATFILDKIIRADFRQELLPNFGNSEDENVMKFNSMLEKFKGAKKISPRELELLERLSKTVKQASFDVAKNIDIAIQKSEKAHSNSQNLFDLRKFIKEDLAKSEITEDAINARALMLSVDLRNLFVGHLLKMKPTELHDKAWSRKKNQDVAINAVYANTTDFNNLTNTIAQDILQAKSVAHQMQIVTLYVKTLENALNSGDFVTALAIRSTFGLSGIYRLDYILQDEKLQKVIKRAEVLFEPSNRYANYRAELENFKKENKQPVPIMNQLLTDLTFTYDGNPDKKVDPDNPERGELLNDKKIGLIGNLHLSHSQTYQDVQAYDVVPRITNYSADLHVVLESEINADSAMFYGKVKLDNIETLEDALKLFPHDKIQTNLKVSLEGTDYLGKEAFLKLIEIILPLFENVQLMDKYPYSQANEILRSMAKWAIDNGIYDGKLKEKVEAIQKKLQPSDAERDLMVALVPYDGKFMEKYVTTSEEERIELKKKLAEIENKTEDASLKKYASNISFELKQIDKLTSLAQEFKKIQSEYKSDLPKEKVYRDLVKLSAYQDDVASQLKSKNPGIRAQAEQYQALENREEFLKQLSDDAGKKLNDVVQEYQNLLIERQQIQRSADKDKEPHKQRLKELNENLEAFRKGVMILNKGDNADNAKMALSTIDKFVALDRLAKERDNKSKIDDIARGVYPYLNDENPKVVQWAALIAGYDILKRIPQLRIADIKLVGSFSDRLDKLITEYLVLAAKDIPFNDKSLVDKENEIEALVAMLDSHAESKFEEVKEAVKEVKDQNKALLEAFVQLRQHKANMKSQKEKHVKEIEQEDKNILTRAARAFSREKEDESPLQDSENKLKELIGAIQSVHQQPKMLRLESMEALSRDKSRTKEEKEATLSDFVALLANMPGSYPKKKEVVARFVINHFAPDVPISSIPAKIDYLKARVASLEESVKNDQRTEFKSIYKTAIEQFNSDIKDLSVVLGFTRRRAVDQFISPTQQIQILISRYRLIEGENNEARNKIGDEIAHVINQLQGVLAKPNSLAKAEAQRSLDTIKEILSKPDNLDILKYCQVQKKINLGLDYAAFNMSNVLNVLGFEKLVSDSDTELARKDNASKVYHELINTENSYIKGLSKYTNIDGVLTKCRDNEKELKKYGITVDEVKELLTKLQEVYNKQLAVREALDSPSPSLWMDVVQEAKQAYMEYIDAHAKFIPKTDGGEKELQLKRNKLLIDVGIDLSVLITPIQRIPRYEMLLKELTKYSTGVHNAAFNEAHVRCQTLAQAINEQKREREKSAFVVKLSMAGNAYRENTSKRNFNVVLELLTIALQKHGGSPAILSPKELKPIIDKMDFSQCKRGQIVQIQKLIDKAEEGYKPTNEELLPYIIYKVANDKVVDELRKLLTDPDFIHSQTPYQRDLLTYLFVELENQIKTKNKVDFEKALKNVKAEHKIDLKTNVTAENALAPLKAKFKDIVRIEHKYRPWKIKDLANAKVEDVLKSISELKGHKKFFEHSFPKSSKSDVINYISEQIKALNPAIAVLPLSSAHEAINQLSEVFGFKFNSAERNTILQAYVDRINFMLNNPAQFNQQEKTALVTFFAQFEYLYKPRSATPAELNKLPALKQLHSLFKNYNKVDMVIQFDGKKIELGAEFKKETNQRKVDYVVQTAFADFDNKSSLLSQKTLNNHFVKIINDLDYRKITIKDSKFYDSTINQIFNTENGTKILRSVMSASSSLKPAQKSAIANARIDFLGTEKLKELLAQDYELYSLIIANSNKKVADMKPIYEGLTEEEKASLNLKFYEAVEKMDVNSVLALRGFSPNMQFEKDGRSLVSLLALSSPRVNPQVWQKFLQEADLKNTFEGAIKAEIAKNKEALVKAAPTLAAVVSPYLSKAFIKRSRNLVARKVDLSVAPDQMREGFATFVADSNVFNSRAIRGPRQNINYFLSKSEIDKLQILNRQISELLYPHEIPDLTRKSNLEQDIKKQKKVIQELESKFKPVNLDLAKMMDKEYEALISQVTDMLKINETVPVLSQNTVNKLSSMLNALKFTQRTDPNVFVIAIREFVNENKDNEDILFPFNQFLDKIDDPKNPLAIKIDEFNNINAELSILKQEHVEASSKLKGLEKANNDYETLGLALRGAKESLMKGNTQNIEPIFFENPALFSLIMENLPLLESVSKKYDQFQKQGVDESLEAPKHVVRAPDESYENRKHEKYLVLEEDRPKFEIFKVIREIKTHEALAAAIKTLKEKNDDLEISKAIMYDVRYKVEAYKKSPNDNLLKELFIKYVETSKREFEPDPKLKSDLDKIMKDLSTLQRDMLLKAINPLDVEFAKKLAPEKSILQKARERFDKRSPPPLDSAPTDLGAQSSTVTAASVGATAVDIKIIERIINGSANEPSILTKIQRKLQRSEGELSTISGVSPQKQKEDANNSFLMNVTNLRNMLVKYKEHPNNEISKLAQTQLAAVDKLIAQHILAHENTALSVELAKIISADVLQAAKNENTTMPSVPDVAPLLSIVSPASTPSISAPAGESSPTLLQDRRKASLIVSHTPDKVEQLLVQNSNSLNSILKFFQKEGESAGKPEMVEDMQKMNDYGVKSITPKKLLGDANHLTIKLYSETPGAGAAFTDKSKTQDLNVGPAKNGGLEYSSKEPLTPASIERACKIAVDSAAPGDKFSLPGTDAQNALMRAGLLKAIQERCKREGVDFKPGDLEIPANAPKHVVVNNLRK